MLGLECALASRFRFLTNLPDMRADKVFFSIALYMGDGGYQVVRMLLISVRHFRATRAALKSGNKYIDTSENSDALGLGIKLQACAVPVLRAGLCSAVRTASLQRHPFVLGCHSHDLHVPTS